MASAIENRIEEAREFWKRIDEINTFKSITKLCEEAEIDINRVKQQRSEGYIPKWKDQIRIARTLGCSLEFLLTGSEEDNCNLDADAFWKRVDDANPYNSLLELSEKIGIGYSKLRQQRVKHMIPKSADLYRLAKELRVSMEYLIDGSIEPSRYSPRTEKVARRFEYTATDNQRFVIENILGLESEYMLKKKEGEDK